MRKIIWAAALLLTVLIAMTAQAEEEDLAAIFTGRNLNGTTVISSLDGFQTFVYNEKRAKERFLPASTFKIPNTLIALEDGAVTGGQEVIKWDGKDRGVAAWNKDQTIETAFPVSCVWFYQELARRVGLDKYKSYLREIHYGNATAGPEVDTFWLNGDLRISALEQIDFLRKVYTRKFGFKASTYELLEKIMHIDQTPNFTFRGKTGWATVPPPVGWIVGWLESESKVWLVATNIEMPNIKDAPLRKEVTLEALKVKGIIK